MNKAEFIASLKRNGLTQVEFAKLTKMSKSTISTWGNSRPVPTWAGLLLDYRYHIKAMNTVARMETHDEH